MPNFNKFENEQYQTFSKQRDTFRLEKSEGKIKSFPLSTTLINSKKPNTIH